MALKSLDPPTSRLVLASGSPRRRTLLRDAGIAFEVAAADIPEERRLNEEPEALVGRLALEKARAVDARLPRDEARWVLGADTIVVLGDAVLGKPDDADHALHLLQQLIGRCHRVVTGVALLSSDPESLRCVTVESRVHMRAASLADLRDYVSTDEPLDKAGAYALQGEGRRFVERVDGSETNVIGLPMDETLALLREAGLAP